MTLFEWVSIFFITLFASAIIWFGLRLYYVTKYENKVRARLKEIDCPLFDFDMMMRHYKCGKPAVVAARSMDDKWKRIKDANKK